MANSTKVSWDKIDEPSVDFFTAINSTTKLPVPGIALGTFTRRLKNPLGINVAATIPVTVSELGFGVYKTSFQSNSVGVWVPVVEHPTYFPFGKRADHRVYDALYYVENEPNRVEPFSVAKADGTKVDDLDFDTVTARLWNPSDNEVSATHPVTFRNDGDGDYRAFYTADAPGKWLLALTQATYFPWGKYNDQLYVNAESGDAIGPVEAIRDLLVADSVLRARIETYEFTSGTSTPSVFTTDVMPKDARLPAIIVARAGGADFGTRGWEGSDTLIDVRLYGDRERNTADLRRTAEIMRKLLNRAKLTLTDGQRAFRCIADPPVAAPDPDGFPGYLVAVRVLLLD